MLGLKNGVNKIAEPSGGLMVTNATLLQKEAGQRGAYLIYQRHQPEPGWWSITEARWSHWHLQLVDASFLTRPCRSDPMLVDSAYFSDGMDH